MEINIESSWKKMLLSEFEKTYFEDLMSTVSEAYRTEIVYPLQKDLFSAFALTPLKVVKVVILGQDPYHSEGQAHGLAFSVRDGVAVPPSLQNIYKEIASDLGKNPPSSGDLTRWAKQGVLLLNSTMTVRGGEAGSHLYFGWEQFTDAIIENTSKRKSNVVFMLWGSHAIAKSHLIDNSKHLVLTAPHPSPLSAHRGFFGSKHFSKTNKYLIKCNKKPINW